MNGNTTDAPGGSGAMSSNPMSTPAFTPQPGARVALTGIVHTVAVPDMLVRVRNLRNEIRESGAWLPDLRTLRAAVEAGCITHADFIRWDGDQAAAVTA
jgi:hypothetical protein